MIMFSFEHKYLFWCLLKSSRCRSRNWISIWKFNWSNSSKSFITTSII